MIKDLLCDALSSGTGFENNVAYRRIILVNALLLLAICAFLFFSAFNLSVQHYPLAWIDAAAATLLTSIFIYLRITKNITFAARFIVVILSLFFIILTYITEGAHLSPMWTTLLPVFAILSTGKKEGLYFSMLFYTVIFFMAYQGLGIWANTQWNSFDLIRLVSVSFIITFLLYFNEFALERSDNKLQEIRAREQDYIKKLQELSITDALTSLYNRRHFDEIVPKLISLAQRKKLYITFFIIDIDHFKTYNDNYGHQAGDKALIAVSNIIKQHIQRDDDFVFRLGGDEFAGIVLSQDPEKIHKHVEQICMMIESLDIKHHHSTSLNKLTTSIGMLSVPSQNNLTADTLYKAADKNLYKAKSLGKHQCVSTLLTAEKA